jgi:hypothetical protein
LTGSRASLAHFETAAARIEGLDSAGFGSRKASDRALDTQQLTTL